MLRIVPKLINFAADCGLELTTVNYSLKFKFMPNGEELIFTSNKWKETQDDEGKPLQQLQFRQSKEIPINNMAEDTQLQVQVLHPETNAVVAVGDVQEEKLSNRYDHPEYKLLQK